MFQPYWYKAKPKIVKPPHKHMYTIGGKLKFGLPLYRAICSCKKEISINVTKSIPKSVRDRLII